MKKTTKIRIIANMVFRVDNQISKIISFGCRNKKITELMDEKDNQK